MICNRILYVLSLITIAESLKYGVTWSPESYDFDYSDEDSPEDRVPDPSHFLKQNTWNITQQKEKNNIVDMLKDLRYDIEINMGKLNRVHNTNQRNSMYRLGYLVNFVNNTCKNILDMYDNITKNQHVWPAVKTMHEYEKVRKANEFLRRVMNSLNQIAQVKLKSPALNEHPKKREDKAAGVMGIAWSYYDENWF